MKLSTKLTYIALFAAGSVFISCSKGFLEINPTTKVSTEKAIVDVASMRTAMVGVYSRMMVFDYYGRSTTLIPEILSDNVFISTRNTGRLISVGNYQMVPEEPTTRDQWQSMYIAAANASIIIQLGEKLTVPDSQKDEYNQLLGEAYALRGLIYMDLLKMYAQPYTYTNDASHPGVPILREVPLQLSELAYPSRSSVKDGYDWVIENLEKAISIMPDRLVINGKVSSKKTRISLNGARGILSRAYLNMGKNADAVRVATDLIGSNQYTMLSTAGLIEGFKSLNNSESIFEIAYNQTNHLGSNSTAAMYAQSSYGDALATEDLYNQYDAQDVRRGFMTKGVRSSAENPAYIVNKYSNVSTYNEHLKVIRLAEIYLNRAEANAKIGGANTAAAQADLNFIRKRANPAAADISLTGNDLLLEIIRERRRELAFEGHRIYDLMRNNLAFTHFISPLIVGRPTIIPVDYPGRDTNHNFLILPIPQQEIDNNDGLKGQQNSGY